MRKFIKNLSLHSAVIAGVALMASACSSLPDRVPAVEQAELAISRLRSEPAADNVAGPQLVNAEQALAEAKRLYDKGKKLELINHQAYLAQRHAEIGRELARSYSIREQISSAEAEQEQLLLAAREADARQSRRAAAQARSVAAAKGREVDQLRGQLEEMAQKNADGNLVVTLSDVLFDTNKAALKPGAFSSMDRLADVLKEADKRILTIEGHTDSRGEASYNLTLSEQRAQAVAEALRQRGVAASRIKPVGRGEEYPVATNDTAAGRQQNRRVEIIISKAS